MNESNMVSPQAARDFLTTHQIEVSEDRRSASSFCEELTELGYVIEALSLQGDELSTFVAGLKQVRAQDPQRFSATLFSSRRTS